MKPIPEKRLFSLNAAAEYLEKSRREIDRLITAGRLIAKRDGKRTVIDRAELDRYCDRLEIVDRQVSA